MLRKYGKEMALRKKLHNELVDLKGNIRVFGRVRPIIGEGEGAVPPMHSRSRREKRGGWGGWDNKVVTSSASRTGKMQT